MKYHFVPIPDLDTNYRYIDEECRKCVRELSEIMEKHGIDFTKRKKEDETMQVTYNGFTGELVKLERKDGYSGNTFHYDGTPCKSIFYDLAIYDSGRQVTHSFTGVKLEDVKFLNGVVSFG